MAEENEPLNYGFPYAAIDASVLPVWLNSAAQARFSVEGKDALKVSALGSLDRGIRIEAGTASGDAVTTVFRRYETQSLPLPDVASRWYLVAIRRNWSGSGTSTLVYLPSGTAAELPPIGDAPTQRSDKPGIESDQPLALVRVTRSDRTVQQIIDLRAFAGPGGVEVVHDLALQYLDEPGAVVRTPNGVSRYQRGDNNVWGWERVDAGRPRLRIRGTDSNAPIVETGVVTLATDANGATAITFMERFPRALASVQLQQYMSPNLGLIHFRPDEGLSHAGRAAFFAYDAAGRLLRNTTGIRVGYTATGD